MTKEEALEMRKQLTEHYGEPVRPVSEYCEAFRAWRDALGDKVRRSEEGKDRRDISLENAYDALNTLLIPIAKSSMLGRMMYGEEQARTEMCPEHKGQWAGLEFGGNICPHGCQLTGWLPNKEES